MDDTDSIDTINDTTDRNSSPTQAHQQTENSQELKPNFSFATPSEMGLRETDPNKISAALRPQPGMTFTPTGGSVSNIQHQLNTVDDTSTATTPTQQ